MQVPSPTESVSGGWVFLTQSVVCGPYFDEHCSGLGTSLYLPSLLSLKS